MWSLEEFFAIGMEREIELMRKPPAGLHVCLGGVGRKRPTLPPLSYVLDFPEWDAENPNHSIPLQDDSVGCFHAYHFFEHLTGGGIIHTLAECQRTLRTGGVINVVVPYYSSQLQATDLTHKTALCEETWRNLFKDDSYRRHGAPAQWRLEVGLNVIIGVKERNLALLTQLYKG